MIGFKGKRTNNSQAGFSLVELMVVVAIIGALAMVAVPRVNRFIAKARTSEAQVNLASIYTFNKNFLVEFTGYTSCLAAMGYNPEGQLRYTTGFAGARVAPPNYFISRGAAANTFPATIFDSTDTKEHCGAGGVILRGCTTLVGSNGAVPPDPIAAAVVNGAFDAFTASATATLTNAGNVDTWTMDNNKVLINSIDGTL